MIGIQEVGSSAQSIANSLGFYLQGFNSDIAIISRYPIAQVLDQVVRLQIRPLRRHMSLTFTSLPIRISHTTFATGSLQRSPKQSLRPIARVVVLRRL